MNITQSLKMAVKSIMSNKLRSFLTMLGIIIGVAAVIALVSVGQGAASNITTQMQGLGTNLLTVNISGRGVATSLSYEESLTYAAVPGVKEVSPVISGQVTAKNGTDNVTVQTEGITPEYETVRDYHVQAGRFILPIDIEYRQRIALIGTGTAQDLFGTSNPVGQSVLLNGQRFTIVGLLASKGSSLQSSNDDKILIPISTAERLLKSKGVRSIYIQAQSTDTMDSAMNLIKAKLLNKFGSEDAYTVFNQQDMLDTASSISNTLSIALGGIAGISLFVGGIGIMNIMLVSVNERTREIGIRKAIGAKRRDILTQFLIESVTLGALGGLIGVGIGFGASKLVGKFTSLSVSTSWNIVLLAFCFSLAIGVIFGIVPANKAAKLKPIDALRTD
ncbi:ABC transporter permease [Paenibacillus sediminis]|uniref:ABC transport system permease protein n=1 Tax=Paenibacillus sediminis TaxID=664909 RepID=A0ABS4H4N0_9BACL|nr:ABC transporter permease [Paenibacillus sediminis]MBP1937416.1 putative ABC transport system permease protein [Paenibacillus sediminis]